MSRKIGIIAATLVVVIGLLGFAAPWLYAQAHADVIYPGVTVGGIALDNRTPSDAQALLQAAADAWLNRGVSVVAEGKSVNISSSVNAIADPDLSYPLWDIDVAESAQRAYRAGRDGSVFTKLWSPLLLRFNPIAVEVAYGLNEENTISAFKENLSSLEQPARDAQVVSNGTGGITITPEAEGRTFSYDSAVRVLRQRLAHLSAEPIALALTPAQPRVRAADLEPLRVQITEILSSKAPLTLTYNDGKRWTINSLMLGSWLGVAPGEDGQLSLTINAEPVEQQLSIINDAIGRAPRDAKFKLEGSKVVEFQPSQEGLTVLLTPTIAKIADYLFNQPGVSAGTVELSLERTPAGVETADVNTLGITELIGVGRSNMAGSPKNRRHNIAVGAAAVNGTLVGPGEEFSLVKTLGPIEAHTGYLPELVIKGSKTIPEYGGGLCQIGTTTFRAAMGSGLPITERRNHAYDVPYYWENGVPGTDATIYPEHPDVRFKNDTATHILIQTRIEGDDVIFEFWGTEDGREAKRTVPVILATIPAPATKMIETLDLKPGEKKCTERAHAGRKTVFTYTVTYPDGRVVKEDFNSSYRPWQAVCLVGVEQLSEPPTPTDGTPTDQPAPDAPVIPTSPDTAVPTSPDAQGAVESATPAPAV